MNAHREYIEIAPPSEILTRPEATGGADRALAIVSVHPGGLPQSREGRRGGGTSALRRRFGFRNGPRIWGRFKGSRPALFPRP